MRKAALIVMAVVVAVMFASVAVAATSTSASSTCPSCAKPGCVKCTTCARPCSATPCAQPCSTCSTPCAPLPKVSVNWQWPTMQITPCAPCAAPVAKPCDAFTRDVLGNKVPAQTYAAGNANTDKATGYESTLVVGQ